MVPKSQEINVKSGLVVDSVETWLVASLHRTVTDPTQKEHKKSCLEVKCLYIRMFATQ